MRGKPVLPKAFLILSSGVEEINVRYGNFGGHADTKYTVLKHHF